MLIKADVKVGADGKLRYLRSMKYFDFDFIDEDKDERKLYCCCAPNLDAAYNNFHRFTADIRQLKILSIIESDSFQMYTS